MRYLALTLIFAFSSYSVWADDNIVILLSWDGMRHDYPDRGSFPALKRIEKNGIRAGRLTPVYLSNTFPGHVSIATGTTPDIHGIVDNDFLDKKKGFYSYSGGADWLLAEPLWVAAERQGVKAATYFWVGSETDWQGQSTSYRMAPFDGSRSEVDKVNKIIEWLDLPLDERPRLIMSYWKGADTTGHFRGPNHDAIVEDINKQDVELGRLLEAVDSRNLWPKTTLMIVSDHGMTRVTESVEFETALEEAGLDVTVTGGAAGKHIHLKKPADEVPVLKILYMNPHLTVLQGDDIPKGMAAPNRTGDIVVIAEPPYTLSRADSLLTKAIVFFSPMLGLERGAHGYNPDLPDMGGIFFAMGRGITAGKKIDNVHQLDIAPTVADILGIDAPAQAKNRPLSLH